MRVDTRPACAHSPLRTVHGAAPPRVAVAGGDQAARQYLRDALARMGWQVVAAAGGEPLSDACRRDRPDLIVADAGVDGLDRAGREGYAVIRVSDSPEQVLPSRLEAVWVLGHLIRPVTEAALMAAVAVALTKEAADLRQALEDRKAIERAKGVLMGRLGLDEDGAFPRLRSAASSRNMKLVEVTHEVIVAEGVIAGFDGR